MQQREISYMFEPQKMWWLLNVLKQHVFFIINMNTICGYNKYLQYTQNFYAPVKIICSKRNGKKNWEREKKNKLKTEKTKTKRRFWWTKTNCMPEWYDIGYAADTIIITSRSLAKSFYYDDARTYWCIENQSNRLEQWTINGTLRPISITVIDNLQMWYSAVQEERIKHNSIFSWREEKMKKYREKQLGSP